MVFQSRMSNPTAPISPKRLAANRANAARSTGPRSTNGKTRSAQNSRKHGFAASKFCAVRLEDLDEFAILHAKAVATYRPANDQELIAVERIALAQQSLYRCASLEAGLTTSAMNETVSPDGFPANLLTDAITHDIQVTVDQNRALCLAVGFERLVRRSDAWKYFLRYHAQSERFYRRAVEEFERLKAQRSELPNEPTTVAELEEIASLADPKTHRNEPTEPTEPPSPPPVADPTIARTLPFPPLMPLKNGTPQPRNQEPR
jgi:hypothetical protein